MAKIKKQISKSRKSAGKRSKRKVSRANTKLSIGDSVLIYGNGQDHVDLHGGCIGKVTGVLERVGTCIKISTMYQIEGAFGFDYFHPKQLVKVMK